jgi:hypothetical protein
MAETSSDLRPFPPCRVCGFPVPDGLCSHCEQDIQDEQRDALAAAERAVTEAAMMDHEAGEAFRACLNGKAKGDLVNLESAKTTAHFDLRSACRALAEMRAKGGQHG